MGDQKVGHVAYVMWGRREMRAGFWWGNWKEIDHLLDLGVDGRINIKIDVQEVGWEDVAQMAGWFEHCAESAGSVNCKEILD